ncbi:hypothetical protein JFV29_12305 [Peribacillus sp. TH16]|uniref:hypothetical protein n=1 Tax=Peribacillus sp. TH16 TaxID=2798482 RepID=UPI0019139B96|nr:hypothetical protein [Peribacillus sp. TH16]MBK5482665.1 hypothetical protein [Peribacillus sp. TH16]
MSYEIKQFNPTKCQFSYRLGKYDCYELRKGTCSLYLSEEEADQVRKEEDNKFYDSNVMFCRDLARSLLNDKYFKDSSFQESDFSIRMHPRDCGHFEFTDGQHRTCIAKHLNIQSMFVKVETYKVDYEIICRACHEKIEKKIEDRKLKNRLLNKLKLKTKNETEIPYDFIDEEYMSFKKEKPVS